MNYRFYSFVANFYLSPLQCGLQTAHAVSEVSQKHYYRKVFEKWASDGKTIIICAAFNHKGVKDAYAFLEENSPDLPYAIFHEDEQSMNCMATACGIIVPEEIYDAGPVMGPWPNTIAWYDKSQNVYQYLDEKQTALYEFIKGYRLA